MCVCVRAGVSEYVRVCVRIKNQNHASNLIILVTSTILLLPRNGSKQTETNHTRYVYDVKFANNWQCL